MHRIDTPYRYQDKFGSGKDGFREGTTGVEQATELTEDWFDGVQEEIIAPIEAMNITPTKGTRDQLNTALQVMRARAAVCSPWVGMYNSQAGGLNAIDYNTEDSVWVAVGDALGATPYILHSVNGIDWHRAGAAVRTAGKNFALNAVHSKVSSSQWVAVGDADGTDAYMLFSSNGTAWSEVSNPKNFKLNGVTYGDIQNVWVAVGESDGTDAYIIKSYNGTTWTEETNTKNVALNAICWAPGFSSSNNYMAVGDRIVADNQPYILGGSNSALLWFDRTAPSGVINALKSVCYSPELNLGVAVGESAADSIPQVITSSDGFTWTRRTTGLRASGSTLVSVQWLAAARLFVAAGPADKTHEMYVSPDGVTWTECSLLSDQAGAASSDIRGIAHNSANGLTVCCGDVWGATMATLFRTPAIGLI